MKWFRLYGDMIDDPKVGTLNDAEFRLWIELLCLACKAGNSGDTKHTLDEVSWSLRRNVTETFRELLHRKLVTVHKTQEGRETVRITKWKERQFQSDSSTDRVRKHREKQKKRTGNVTETLQKRKCNGPDTDTDTDTEEKEKKDKKEKFDPIAVRPDWISEKDWSDLVGHRRLKKAAESQRAYTALVNQIKKAVQAGFNVEDVIDTICQRGWIGFQSEWMEKKQNQQGGKVHVMTPRQGYMKELGEGLEALDQIEGKDGDITTQSGASGAIPTLESLP